MCLITEHAKAKQKIKELEARISEIMPLPPQVERIAITTSQLYADIAKMKLTPLYGLMDSNYWHTTNAGWLKIIHYIYAYSQVPISFADTCDCEDWALWLKAMVTLHFQLNAFGVVIGDIPYGKHGFNLFWGDGQYLWEPNPAFGLEIPFKIMDAHEYKPEYILM